MMDIPVVPSPCFCRRNPHARLQDACPDRYPELQVESKQGTNLPEWRLRCSDCATRWRVCYIPGGGIYGDFAWERMDQEPERCAG